MIHRIAEYRAQVAAVVRRERRDYDQPIQAGLVDIDVSIFDGAQSTAEGRDSSEHRRNALDARAELWKNIRVGDIDNDDVFEAVQVFEEMSHTE